MGEAVEGANSVITAANRFSPMTRAPFVDAWLTARSASASIRCRCARAAAAALA